MHVAVYTIAASSAAAARSLATALAVEAEDPLPRASVRVEGPGDGLEFRIIVEAEDLSTLRAASNSFLKWLKAADAALDHTAAGSGAELRRGG